MAITPAEIDGLHFIFISLIIGYFNSLVDIFIGNPDMPGPENVVAGIFDSNNSITLSDSILFYTERDVAVTCIVIFYIGNQIRCILPYKFSFDRSAVSVFVYVRISDRIAGMVDEITQNIVCGWCRRCICGSVGYTIFDGISIYQRERIVSRSTDNVTVSGIFIC